MADALKPGCSNHATMHFSLLMKLLAILIFTVVFASKDPKSTSPTLNQCKTDIITQEQIQLMSKTIFATDEFLVHCSQFSGMNDHYFKMLKRKFVHQVAAFRLAEIGEIPLFYLVNIFDDAVENVVRMLMNFGLSSNEGESSHGKLPARMGLDEDIRPAILRKSEWKLQQILNSDAPGFFHTWALCVHSLLDSLTAQLQQTASYYANLFKISENLTGLLDTTFRVLEQIESTGNYRTWKNLLDFVMDHYFEPVRHIYTEGSLPTVMDEELLLRLAKCGIIFKSVKCNIDLALKTREVIFKRQAEKSLSVFEYMRERKTISSIPFVDAAPFNNLQPSVDGVKQLLNLTNELNTSMTGIWYDHVDDETRKELCQFSYGLHVLRDFLWSVERSLSIFNLGKCNPPHQLMVLIFQIIPVVNSSLFEFTSSLFSDSMRKNLETFLLVPNDCKEVKAVKATALEAAYNIVEAELAILYMKDSMRALRLYRFLEICRGVVILGLRARAAQVIDLVHFPLSQTRTISLVIYEECRDFLITCLPKLTFEDVIYEMMMQNVAKTFHAFSKLFTHHTIPSDLAVEFYVFLDRRIKENANDPIWKPLRGKIRPDMLKPRTAPVDMNVQQLNFSNPKLVKSKRKSKFRTNSIATLSISQSEPKIGPGNETAGVADENNEETPRIVSEKSIIEFPTSQQRPIKTSKHVFQDVCMNEPKGTMWDDIWTRMFPKFANQFIMSQIKPVKSKAITSRKIEVYEEPSHYAEIAKTVGFDDGNIDSRDHLMAIILIGERIMAKKILPLLIVFQRNKEINYLFEMFYKSIGLFETEVRKLVDQDPTGLQLVLNEASLDSASDILVYIKYYRYRCAVCHPFVPKLNDARKNISARHLTTLDFLQAFDPRMISRMRHHLESYEEIFVRSIDTELSRPRNLFSSQYTDKALAIIGLFELLPLEDIRIDRNKAAHKTCRDNIYAAYIEYVFGNSPDYELLKTL